MRFADDSDLTAIGQALKKFLKKHFRYVKAYRYEGVQAEARLWKGEYQRAWTNQIRALDQLRSVERVLDETNKELDTLYSQQASRYAFMPPVDVDVRVDQFTSIRTLTVRPRQASFQIAEYSLQSIKGGDGFLKAVARHLAEHFLDDLAEQINTAVRAA